MSSLVTGCKNNNTLNSNSNSDATQTDDIQTEQTNEISQIITGTNVCEYEDYIFYRNTNDNGSLYRYNVKDGSYIRLFDKNYNAFLHSISVYDEYVYFVTRTESDTSPTLYKIHIDGGEAERLLDNVGDDYVITENAVYYTDAVCDEGNIFGLHKYTFSDKSDTLLNAYENNNLILKGNKLFYKRRNLAEQMKCTFEVLDITNGAVEEIPTGNIAEICYATTLAESNIIFFAAYYIDGTMQLACYDIETGEYNVLSEKFYVINGVAAVNDDLVYFQAFTQPRGTEGFYESCTVYEWKNGKVDVYTALNGNDMCQIENLGGKPLLFSNGNLGGEKILGDERLNVVVEE